MQTCNHDGPCEAYPDCACPHGQSVDRDPVVTVEEMEDILVPRPVFVECGYCSMYHPSGFGGDCRDDANRFSIKHLDEKYGNAGWVEVELMEHEREH